MDVEERILVREASTYWWVFLVSGVIWLLVSWVVLRMDVDSLATVGLLIGVTFLAAGINEVFFAGVVSGGWKLLHYVMALIFLLGGLWAFIRPINTFFALASVLGLILLFQGAFEIARGIGTRGQNPYWVTSVVTGVLFILLSFWVSGSDRLFVLARRTSLILFWVGFMALFRGVTQIMLAFAVRRAGRELVEV